MIFLNNIKKMKIGGKEQMIIKYGAVKVSTGVI